MSSMLAPSFDFAIIGAGIIGLTAANELKKRFPKAKIAILKKETLPGVYASGRNSGVLQQEAVHYILAN